MRHLRGRIALITGASSGIGEATARLLADEGMRVVLAARREDRLEELRSEIEEMGGEAIVVPTDVTDREQVEALAGRTIEAYGAIDVLVNNAGVMPLSFLRKLRVEEWERMLDVNLKGALYAIAAVLGPMRERGTGHVVNVSSTAGRRVIPSAAVYCATKFALTAISEGLRSELADEGSEVRVTCIEPGATATELRGSIRDPEARALVESFGATRLGPEDVARAVLYALCRPAHVDVAELMMVPHPRR